MGNRPIFGRPETGVDYRFAPHPSGKLATCVNCMVVDDRIYMAYVRSKRVWMCESCEDWMETK